MRLLQVQAKSEELPNLQKYYEEGIMPTLQRTPGCLYACLMQSVERDEVVISMTLWESPAHANAYEKGGTYQKLLNDARPMLVDSDEWRMQLTNDLKLEYSPVPAEPTIKASPIEAMSGESKSAGPRPGQMFLRIVSVTMKPGMLEEYKNRYVHEVIPGLQETKGCRHAYLTFDNEDSNQAFSVTIWDSREAAEEYERSGRFAQLLDKVKHTFSDLVQWKMKLDKSKQAQSATSEDLKVEGYSIVSGKSFES
jgi:heme-degrading monooxygenase HmoA